MRPLDAAALRALAAAAPPPGAACATCEPLRCPGWESLPAGFDERLLRPLGTLRPTLPEGAGPDDLTWAEHHPAGTRTDSPLAPIAPGFHPYNRSDLAACSACGRLLLRWTEGGGYFSDARVRELDAALSVDGGLRVSRY